MVRTLVISLLALVMSSSVIGRELSISEAIDLALEQSHRLKASQRQLESSKRLITAANRDRWPTISLSANASFLDAVPSFDISIPGGQSFEREFGSKDNYQADVRLSLPVYTGGRLSSQVTMADAAMKQVEAALSGDSQTVIYEARATALGLMQASQIVISAQAAYDRVMLISKDIQAKFDAGVVDSIALLETMQAVTQGELNVQRAHIVRRQNEIRLALMIGVPVKESLSITDSVSIPEKPVTLPLSDTKFELVAADRQIDLLRSRANLARSSYFPSLSVYTGYSYGMPNLDRFNNTWNDYLTVGARLDWQLNLGGSQRSRELSSRLEYEAATHVRSDLYRKLDQRSQLAQEQWRISYNEYLAADKDLSIAKASYQLALTQHENGALTTNRLLELQSSLTAAESAYQSGILNCHLAETAYRYAAGDTIR